VIMFVSNKNSTGRFLIRLPAAPVSNCHCNKECFRGAGPIAGQTHFFCSRGQSKAAGEIADLQGPLE
jgi:hypothetical protein